MRCMTAMREGQDTARGSCGFTPEQKFAQLPQYPVHRGSLTPRQSIGSRLLERDRQSLERVHMLGHAYLHGVTITSPHHILAQQCASLQPRIVHHSQYTQ
jgi:hypothetical protein